MQRGRVLKNPDTGPGLLASDGKQYTFTLEGMWKSEFPPRPGMVVDIDFDSLGAPAGVHIVPDSQIAKEQAEQAIAGARRQGGERASSLKARSGASVLVAEAILLLGFFVLPSITIAFVNRSLTGWDLIGVNVNAYNTSEHGFLSLVALLCLFAPLAVPFIRQTWSRWLYAAPLGFTVLAPVSVYFQLESAGHAARQSAGDLFGVATAREMTSQADGLLHIGIGAFVVTTCALYLASKSLKANT